MPETQRMDRLRAALPGLGVDGYAVVSQEGSDAANLRYLTGFTGTFGVLLVTAERATFLTDSRYLERVRGTLAGVELKQIRRVTDLAETVRAWQVDRLGVNAARLDVNTFHQLADTLEGAKVVPCDDPVAGLRRVKDEDEIGAIARAQALTDRGFDHVLGRARPGALESELAWELESFLRRNGSEGVAFPIMVAAGPNSALPHHETGARELRRGDWLLFDFGARVDGYCADMTRTVCLGQPTEAQRAQYDLVRRAQEAALGAIRAGASGKAVDRVARDLIEGAGHGEHFGHGLGHGLGLEVHETPRLSYLKDDTLEEGAVVTVEPGVYLPGSGGVRIEDLVVVTRDGARNLTGSSKELISL